MAELRQARRGTCAGKGKLRLGRIDPLNRLNSAVFVAGLLFWAFQPWQALAQTKPTKIPELPYETPIQAQLKRTFAAIGGNAAH